jgi:hypothetical protein
VKSFKEVEIRNQKSEIRRRFAQRRKGTKRGVRNHPVPEKGVCNINKFCVPGHPSLKKANLSSHFSNNIIFGNLFRPWRSLTHPFYTLNTSKLEGWIRSG